MSDKDSTATIYYNSACPVCDAGIRSEQRRLAGCAVRWVDVHAEPEAARDLGAGVEDVRRRLHVVDAAGRVFVGSEAVAEMSAQGRGRGWLARALRLPGLRRLGELGYELFAGMLYRWNLRRGHWSLPAAPAAGAPPEPNADPAELAKFSALAARWWDPDSEFRPLHHINPVRLEWIDGLVGGLAGRKVLDVGCGGGILAEAMARRGAQVAGIDLARAPLAVANIHARQSGVAVDYRLASAEQLARRHAGAYDVVTCMEMLEHVPRPAETIAACAALAKPGGWVVFSTINRTPLSWLMAIVGAEYVLRLLPRGTHQWRRFIRPAELRAAAAGEGLVLQDARGLGYNPFTRRFRLHRWQGVGYLLAFRSAC